MENFPQKPHRRRSSTPSNTPIRAFAGFGYRKIIAILAALVLALAIALGVIIALNWQNLTHIESRTVRFGFENIGELATQAGYFTNVQVVEGDRDIFGIVVPFTHKKYIYSYDGVIKAGLDFSKVQVQTDEAQHMIHVLVPEAKILSTEIDPNSLQVYDETNNAFNRLKLTDINASLVELREEIQKTALEQGILQNAATNAELLLKGFISGAYDLTEYSVTFETTQTEEVQNE